MSLVGHYGDDVAAMADKFLKLGLYDFSGSDIHGTRHFEIFNKPVTVKNHKVIPELLERISFLNYSSRNLNLYTKAIPELVWRSNFKPLFKL